MHQTRRLREHRLEKSCGNLFVTYEMLAATNTEAEDQELTWDPCRGGLGWESQQLFRLEDTPRLGLKLERKP